MYRFLAIGLGAALGANLRYLIGLWSITRFGPQFPYGTIFINFMGSFLISLVMIPLSTRTSGTELIRLFAVTGFLGGFTTFSTFSYESYSLWAGGNAAYAAANIVVSLGLGLGGVFSGAVLARILF
jgi:CrcB protein